MFIFAPQENLDALGDVLLQDTFNVWDPKALIKKGRERHIFLFEMCLLFAKDVKDSHGKSKYLYKFKLMVSKIGQYFTFLFLFLHVTHYTSRSPFSSFTSCTKNPSPHHLLLLKKKDMGGQLGYEWQMINKTILKIE